MELKISLLKVKILPKTFLIQGKESLKSPAGPGNGHVRFPRILPWLGAIVFGFNLHQQEAA